MKKILVLFAAFLLSVGVNYAQPQGRQRMSPEEREKMMVDSLGLNKDQQAKYHAISEKYREKFDEIRQQMRDADQDSRRDLFPKMRELMQERNKEVRAILNAEQQKKFDEMQKQREERMRNRGMHPQRERGGDVRPGK